MSRSISFELPVKLTTALTLPHDELPFVLSQFKSTLFELPAKLITPVYVAPLIWYVITFELPTWSIFKFVVAPVEADDVVLLPIVLFSPSCNISKVRLAPD